MLIRLRTEPTHPPQESGHSWPRVGLAGHPLDLPSLDATAGWVAARADSAEARAVVLLRDAHALLAARRDDAVGRAEAAADLVLPDGMPLVWLMRACGYPATERVYGPDLMLAVCAETAMTDLRHAFLGGGPGVADDLAERLTARFPGLTVAGTLAPAISDRPERTPPDPGLLSAIADLRPDILWVGLGTPKQDLWMHAYRPHLDVPVMIGCGAAVDLLSGHRPQAPRWIRTAGLEWAFRLGVEPRRLGRRYLRTVPAFAALALWWWATGAVKSDR